MDINKAILIGRAGRDPEIFYTQAGEPIANFTLATGKKWKNKAGEAQEQTEWHRVKVFGKLAQVVRDYVKKGTQLYIEGTIHYSEWTDKEGQKKYGTEIQVGGFSGTLALLGAKPAGGDSPAKAEAHPETGFQASDEDVPF